MKIEYNSIQVIIDEISYRISIKSKGEIWEWHKNYEPSFYYREKKILFSEFNEIEMCKWEDKYIVGIEISYKGLGNEKWHIKTKVWIDKTTEEIYFEYVPIDERIESVTWPGYMEFEKQDSNWYTLLTVQQGILIPNTWKEEVNELPFDGLYGTEGGYMSWFGQVKRRRGYIAICETPWDARNYIFHPKGGGYTYVGINWLSCLGKISYSRIIKYKFFDDCDYVDICKYFKEDQRKKGNGKTLLQKQQNFPDLANMYGIAFVHTNIKMEINKDSDMYGNENKKLMTFDDQKRRIKNLYKQGIKGLYVHLDGWSNYGYDSRHPEYGGICREAGGEEKFAELISFLHQNKSFICLHDQYRDFYCNSSCFDEGLACVNKEKISTYHSRWAGGRQTYLCASKALEFIKNNYNKVKKYRIDGLYLDAFVCNSADECYSEVHLMTRKECYEYRKEGLHFLYQENIMPSSEEVADWAIDELITCHFAPYDFMVEYPTMPRRGIPVPLFNLVFHECVIIPWIMKKTTDNEDYMLYALINGGAPYIILDNPYLDIDGCFDNTKEISEEENIERCKQVMKLHSQIANQEMVFHELLNVSGMQQRSVFADGTEIKVDFEKGTYQISNIYSK